MGKRILRWIVMLWCGLLLFTLEETCTVCAKTEGTVTSFSGDVTMLKKEDRGYVMQVTVANSGEDFTGTVQVVFTGSNTANCAYNTKITLPAQGIKQFTIHITDTVADTDRGVCGLKFLDESGTLLQSIELKNVFGNALTELPVGILSEEPTGFSYLEAKGERLSVRDGYYPVKLMEVNENTLRQELDGLFFLVIDQYDVSSLGEENIRAIEDWVKGGGWLMIGTGAYGEKTLSGFDENFLNLSVSSVSAPGEENALSRTADAEEYYYYDYTADGVDFTKMAVAELDNNITDQDFYESAENPAITVYWKRGAVSVYYCSLGDGELQKLRSSTASMMYRELTVDHYSHSRYSGWEYIREDALSFIDHANTNVDFTGLKVMITLYVVLVGPVLYLVLRKCKKREWYWVCVPALSVLFIVIVYFFGLGSRVNEAKVYSVTAQGAEEDRKDTYLLAYQSGMKPWNISLEESYRMAGPETQSGYYYGGYTLNTEDYFYVVENGSQGLSVGVKPEENFDGGFFYAAGSGESRGTISCQGFERLGKGTFKGTLTNGTDCDMSYMAVKFQGYFMVFSDVKAGETIDLRKDYGDRCVYAEEFDDAYDLLYSLVHLYNYRVSTDLGYEQADMAALLIGLSAAEEEEPAGPEQGLVIGIVRDYDRVTTGKYDETSYGCLYSYVVPEGGQNASN